MSENLWRTVRDARDAKVLRWLKAGTMTQVALGGDLGIRPPTICRIIARLVQAGLVEKTVDGVRLTAKGRRKVSNA